MVQKADKSETLNTDDDDASFLPEDHTIATNPDDEDGISPTVRALMKR